MAGRDGNSIEGAAREVGWTSQRAVLFGFLLLTAFCAIAQAPAQSQPPAEPNPVQNALPGGDPLPLLLPELPAGGVPAGDAGAAGDREVARLKDALEQMTLQNPVVARVNGHEIRWAEVIASADDLPPRYREQVESVFPALLDRLVDLRLLADAARAQGLREDPEVRQRLASYEDRVLSSVILERRLADSVTTADLRARYDALVAARRGDREIRARHILVDSKAAAQDVIARLNEGAVFISLATELSQGSSAGRGGDLGYFHPSRMAPAFAAAALALEPGDYTRDPVETEFGWHVILLVDRRADNIPSFLDMQAGLRKEATKEAVDRLVLSLRREASLEMFPQDAVARDAAGGAAAGTGGSQ
jgi:peptidyl-prolyl cis-trans isomerase C